jgi:peptidoglycan/LPS O-acetylase OafA/YrhL
MSATTGYRPALDGVRALAIVGVMTQHLHLSHAPGGALGVDVFFVLSGYLITGILATERASTGSIDLPAFYVRRVARLYPALLALVVVGGTIAVTDLNAPTRTVVLSGVLAATYVTDIATYTHTSAWAFWGFTWSLAIEEHFYLLWPGSLRLMRRIDPRKVAVVAGLAVLVVGEVFARGGSPGPSTTYFQPQTHAFGLFAGCVLALSAPPRWTRHLTLPCLAAIIALMVAGPSATDVSYLRIGVPVTGLLTVGMLAGLEHEPLIGQLLGWAPIRRIGVISYGLYLYHQLIFNLLDYHLHVRRSVEIVLNVVVAIAVAEISYRFYESPIRSRGRRFRRTSNTNRAAAH